MSAANDSFSIDERIEAYLTILDSMGKKDIIPDFIIEDKDEDFIKSIFYEAAFKLGLQLLNIVESRPKEWRGAKQTVAESQAIHSCVFYSLYLFETKEVSTIIKSIKEQEDPKIRELVYQIVLAGGIWHEDSMQVIELIKEDQEINKERNFMIKSLMMFHELFINLLDEKSFEKLYDVQLKWNQKHGLNTGKNKFKYEIKHEYYFEESYYATLNLDILLTSALLQEKHDIAYEIGQTLKKLRQTLLTAGKTSRVFAAQVQLMGNVYQDTITMYSGILSKNIKIDSKQFNKDLTLLHRQIKEGNYLDYNITRFYQLRHDLKKASPIFKALLDKTADAIFMSRAMDSPEHVRITSCIIEETGFYGSRLQEETVKLINGDWSAVKWGVLKNILSVVSLEYQNKSNLHRTMISCVLVALIRLETSDKKLIRKKQKIIEMCQQTLGESDQDKWNQAVNNRLKEYGLSGKSAMEAIKALVSESISSSRGNLVEKIPSLPGFKTDIIFDQSRIFPLVRNDSEIKNRLEKYYLNKIKRVSRNINNREILGARIKYLFINDRIMNRIIKKLIYQQTSVDQFVEKAKEEATRVLSLFEEVLEVCAPLVQRQRGLTLMRDMVSYYEEGITDKQALIDKLSDFL